VDILCIDVTIQVTSEMCLLALQFNPLAYTNACQAFWAIDVFSFNSSLLSVDGMTCLILFQSLRNDLSNGISYVEIVSIFRL